MTPQAILRRAESLGLVLIPEGEHIRIRGPREAIAEITPLVKQHKPALLAALSIDAANSLDDLIRDAAAYYEATPEDMEIMQHIAQSDPDGLRLALQTDPLRPFYRRVRA